MILKQENFNVFLSFGGQDVRLIFPFSKINFHAYAADMLQEYNFPFYHKCSIAQNY